MKSEKYQQGMVMIIQLVVYWIMHIYRQLQINCSWFKETKSFRSIQQIVFQGVVGGESNTKIKNKTIQYSWKVKRNSTRICKRNSKSSVVNINGWI